MKSMTTLSKIDFKKLDKKYYYPKDIEIIDVPHMSFITISGAGVSADVKFQEAIHTSSPLNLSSRFRGELQRYCLALAQEVVCV